MSEIYNWLTTNGYPVKRTEGFKYGVEIEIEGENLCGDLTHWRKDYDPSLKSAENAEYVTRNPENYDVTVHNVRSLYQTLGKRKSVIYDSVRAGVHIHINVQDNTWKELFTFLSVYFTVENVMTKWCGKGRSGNHFCLRSKDAEYLQEVILDAATSKNFRKLKTEDIRYSTLNLLSLFKYGTIEFRALRTPLDPDTIVKWIDIITHLWEKSKEFKDPQHVMETLSLDGVNEYIRNIFGKHYNSVIYKDAPKHVQESIYYTQDLSFMIDWPNYKVEVVKPEKIFLETDPMPIAGGGGLKKRRGAFVVPEGVHPVDAWLAMDIEAVAPPVPQKVNWIIGDHGEVKLEDDEEEVEGW